MFKKKGKVSRKHSCVVIFLSDKLLKRKNKVTSDSILGNWTIKRYCFVGDKSTENGKVGWSIGF